MTGKLFCGREDTALELPPCGETTKASATLLVSRQLTLMGPALLNMTGGHAACSTSCILNHNKTRMNVMDFRQCQHLFRIRLSCLVFSSLCFISQIIFHSLLHCILTCVYSSKDLRLLLLNWKEILLYGWGNGWDYQWNRNKIPTRDLNPVHPIIRVKCASSY